jgi:anti-sigma regulatory factor (Ser/Thr protein kinase)
METTTVSFWVRGGRGAATVARHSVLSTGAGLSPAASGDLALLVSELVTNAIQHGGADPSRQIEVTLSAGDQRVRVEVSDPGADTAGSTDRLTPEGGWGLVLVDQLSERWGRERTPAGGSVAWFELSLADRAA